jgi:hypothetical protein
VTTLGVCFQPVPSFSETGTTVELVLEGLARFEQQAAGVTA